ncbi:MAG: hypothetical protein LBF78_01710 [Treponema sp.]|jgi:hypothetical protein|nr:hypothetical protein [Treponema sp.]
MKGMIFVLAVIPVLCFAENNGDKNYNIIPIFKHEFVSFENQQYHTPRGGMIFMKGEQTLPLSVERDSLMIMAFYQPYLLKEKGSAHAELAGYSDIYHKISFAADRRIKRHNILGGFRSSSDEPVYGGIQTFQTTIGYGYEFVRTESLSLTLGASIMAPEFDIGSITVPVFPMPFIKFDFTSSWINLSFNWTTSPELDVVIAPESKIRMNGTFSMEGFSGIRDFLFECTLWYRFFNKEDKLGDFAGIGAGIKNDSINFDLGEKDRMYDMGYYSVFGTIDVSFLEISGGYIFRSWELYDGTTEQSSGNGYFISARLTYRF